MKLIKKREWENALTILMKSDRVSRSYMMPVESFYSAMDCSEERTSEILDYLKAKGFVKVYRLGPDKDFYYNIEVLGDGMFYFENKRAYRQEFIRKSVIVPILVTISTYLVINYLIPHLDNLI